MTNHFTIREATQSDNAALIDLELRSPLFVDDMRESYDRSPDFFACHRLQGEHKVLLAEANGRPVGVMAGVIQNPLIQGQARCLVYIQRARVDPEFQGQKVAWNLANELFTWSHELGADGPYYLIAPGNERSVAFGGRAGRRWPMDVRLLALGVSAATPSGTQVLVDGVTEGQLSDVVALVNSMHAGEDFFEPLTVDSLRERLGRDRQYRPENLRCVTDGGKVVSVAGFWDKGATTEQIHVNLATGAETRSRSAVVTDWGWSPSYEAAFAGLLRGLAMEVRALGRDRIVICEPSPGIIPNPGLPAEAVDVSLYTPSFDPPEADAIRGIYVDLLTL